MSSVIFYTKHEEKFDVFCSSIAACRIGLFSLSQGHFPITLGEYIVRSALGAASRATQEDQLGSSSLMLI